ncbi:MAG TPA: hypothetical protein VKH17_06550 [Acidimicrobiia bacterium]|nr:hypothetical protein [Acidimicrobiia bacterium]
MRKFIALLAIVGATIVVALSQTSGAYLDGHEQPCQDNRKPETTALWSGMNLRYDGQKMVDGYHKKSDGVSNDADQHNGKLCQEAKNEPHAWVDNDNKNINPQFTLVGSNDSWNNQSNDTWIDQSQHAKAVQANALWQGISVNHPPAGWLGGGGPPLSNDADQSNGKLEQEAKNKPFAWVDNDNVNFNPQFTLVGSNSSWNNQSNETSIDQSQHAKAAQVNAAGQGIHVGPPIDPSNNADQSNGKLQQEAKNEPHAGVDNKNVNFNPQFTLVGNNSSTNSQSNETSIDQSQHAGALQLNVLGQAIGLG